jgi:IS5 family transposase
MRLYGWSYQRTASFVNDSLVLRQFCRVDLEKVLVDTTLIRWANTIGPQTLQKRNDRAVQFARSLKVTRGRKLRGDTTAVETDILYSTDSALIGEGVRVLSRLLRRAKTALGAAAADLGAAFRSRVRTVRRLSQPLHCTLHTQGAICGPSLAPGLRQPGWRMAESAIFQSSSNVMMRNRSDPCQVGAGLVSELLHVVCR